MLSFSLTKTTHDYEAVQKYIHAVYLQQGYVSINEKYNEGIRAYIGKPGTYTVVARHGAHIIGTISLIHADESKMPMENLYSDEVRKKMQNRHAAGEIGQFAVAPIQDAFLDESQYSRLDITLGLFAHAIFVAAHKGVRHCFFTINPKHRSFYESIGCIQIGDEKEYEFVEGAPALAYVLDVDTLKSIKNNFLVEKMFNIPITDDFLSEDASVSGVSN